MTQLPSMKAVNNLNVVSKKKLHEIDAYTSASHCETGFWAGLEIGWKKGGKAIGFPVIIEVSDEVNDCSVPKVFGAALLLQRVSGADHP